MHEDSCLSARTAPLHEGGSGWMGLAGRSCCCGIDQLTAAAAAAACSSSGGSAAVLVQYEHNAAYLSEGCCQTSYCRTGMPLPLRPSQQTEQQAGRVRP